MNNLLSILLITLMAITGSSNLFAMKRQHEGNNGPAENSKKQKTEHEKSIPEILAQQEIDSRKEAANSFNEISNENKGFLFKKLGPLKLANFCIQPTDEDYNRRVSDFEMYENDLEALKTKEDHELYSLASMWGGINYMMSLDEMKAIAQKKFKVMKQNKCIVSKEDFEQIKDHYYTAKAHTDLTRIWGIEHLHAQIDQSDLLKTKYGVPGYIIVLDNPNHIKIQFYFAPSEPWPTINSLMNGVIYFEKIKGVPIASRRDYNPNSTRNQEIGITSGIGFNDFSDPGNILYEQETQKNYIVDTEFKSFNISLGNLKPILEYAGKKFHYLNGIQGPLEYEFELDD